MKTKITEIKTDCDVSVNIQKTTPILTTQKGSYTLPDEICFVATDSEDNEMVIFFNKKNAIDLAIALLKLTT